MIFRIHRTVIPEAVVLALSGELDGEHANRLQALLATEQGHRVVLDLDDVTLVDRAAVQFLARVECVGTRVVNCPDYVRSWMDAEQSAEEADEKGGHDCR